MSSITIAPSSISIVVGGIGTLVATPKDAAGAPLTGRALSWSSGNVAIATVSDGVVTGVTTGGPVTISATSEGVTGTAQVTVSTVPVATVTMNVTSTTVEAGATTTLIATPHAANGTALTDRVVNWSTANAALATVQNGVVTGVAAGGPVTITATSEGKTATAQVTVTAIPVATVVVSPPTNTVNVGGTVTLTATAKDNAGVTLTGRAVSWLSSNQAIATVANGVVTGVTPGGPVTITATSEGKSGTATINVTTPMAIWTESDELRLGGPVPVGFTVFAVGPDGTAIAANGSAQIFERTPAGAWQPASSSIPGLTTIGNVFVDAGGTRWAVGNNGIIARRSAAGWVVEPSGTTQMLNDISILPNGTGLAVGANGTAVARSLSGLWGAIGSAPTASPLVGVSVINAGFAIAIGGPQTALGLGGVYRWDGGTWTALPSPAGLASFNPHRLVVVSPTETYVTGSNGTDTFHMQYVIAEWNGGAWSTPILTPSGQGPYSAGLTRCADGTVYASVQYGQIYRRSGGVWSVFSTAGNTSNIGNGLNCDADNSLMVTGTEGLLMRYRNGVLTTERWRPALKSVSLAANGTVFGASIDGIARYDGSQWTRSTALQWPPTVAGIYFAPAIWTDGTTAVVAGTPSGRFQGGGWTWGANIGHQAIWGPSANLMFADGGYQNISTMSGGVWTTAPLPGPADQIGHIHGVTNFAVANGLSTWYMWTGGAWTTMTAPGAFVNGPIWVFSPTDVVTINSFFMYRWNGTQWTSQSLGGANLGDARCIVARSPTEIYAFGTSKAILGYDGTNWRQVGTTSQTIDACAWVGNAGIAVGPDGLVVRGVAAGQTGLRSWH